MDYTYVLASFASVVTFYVASFLLTAFLPGSSYVGYAKDSSGRPLAYKLNGFRVTCLTLVIEGCLFFYFAPTLDKVAIYLLMSSLAACCTGLLGSFVFYLKGPWREHVCAHANRKMRPLERFYLGWEMNPRLWTVDVNMWLYQAGGSRLAGNVMYALLGELLQYGSAQPRTLVYSIQILWFVFDYFTFENVHLYTYDIFAENIGFKMVWGNLCFYPYFYCIGMYPLITSPTDSASGINSSFDVIVLAASSFLFVCGWVLSRGANMQKYFFKLGHSTPFLGIKQDAIKGKLLVSGFWGVSRHINYLGEVLMALGLALPGGEPVQGQGLWLLPWLYPLYYVILLVPRQIYDDKRCRVKYGRLWEEYCRRVPWRIVPHIY